MTVAGFSAIVPRFYRPPCFSVAGRDHLTVLDRAALLTGYPRAVIAGASRHREVCHVRWAAMHAMRANGLSTPQIGRRLGNRDPSTVAHGLRRADDLRRTDPVFAALVEALA